MAMKVYSFARDDQRLAAVIHLANAKVEFSVNAEGEILADVGPELDAQITGASSMYCVIQEGGSSEEIYLAADDSLDGAQKLRQSMSDGSYRSSNVVEVPCALAALGELFFESADQLLKASLDFSYPDDDMEDGIDVDRIGQTFAG